MKKKIVKRSLALGALMAFVITGSAMAAGTGTVDDPLILNNNTNLPINGTVSQKTICTLGAQEVVLSHDKDGVYFIEHATITGTGSEKLTIKSGFITGHTDGVIKNTTINNVGEVNLIQSGGGTALGYGVDSIEADVINIESNGYSLDDNGNKQGGWGVYADDGASHTLIATTSINIESLGRTVYVGNGTINIIAPVVTISSDRSIEGKENNALCSNGTNSINLSADKIVMTGGIDLKNANGNINLQNEDRTGTPETMQITGNINAASGTLTGLTFNGSDSFLTGTINTAGNVDETGNSKAPVTFNGATWNVTGESKVQELSGTDVNIVVNSVDQEGLVKVNNNKVEKVTVTGSGAIADAIAAGEDGATLEALVNTVKDNNDSSIASVVATEEGLVSGAMSATVVRDETTGETSLTNQKVAKNVTNASLADNAVALKAHWRHHMNDMNKRMGELRNANGEHGVWVRMVRGENEYDNNKAQYNQYQLGYDEKLSTDKRWTIGAAVTFAEGDSSYGKGSTEDDSTAFAIYGSKLNDDGTFVDLIARYARLESDITTNKNEQGDYSTNGYSVSAEFGKRIQQGKGLWIEPQFELTYGSVDSADYVIGQKTVHMDSMDSFIARAGVSIGKDIKQGNVYARASYLYDFDGEADTVVTSSAVAGVTDPHHDDLGGGWWEVGVGANINLSDATYIYADVEKTFGGEVDTNWQWNLGVRYSF